MKHHSMIHVISVVVLFVATVNCISFPSIGSSSSNLFQNSRTRYNLPNFLIQSKKLIPKISMWKQNLRSFIGDSISPDNKMTSFPPSALSKRTSMSKPNEVKWRHCSAKKIKAYLTSDIKIQCEMVVPLGSAVIWTKNEKVLRRNDHPNIYNNQIPDNRLSYLSAHGDEIEEGNVQLRLLDSGMYMFHVMSIFHLDCLSSHDLGIYKITIKTPSEQNYTRSFDVQKMNGGSSKVLSNCWRKMILDFWDFDPRISEFAKKIIGKEGYELTLPCRPVKYNYMTIIWEKVGRELTGANYTITAEGDLKIHKLKSIDQGMFTCDITDNGSNIYDHIVTYVEVRN